MDALKDSTLRALEVVINDAEDLSDVHITQDIGSEVLVIEAGTCGFKTTMNCAMNSVGATIRQVCMHINKRTLFSYKEDYTIGG
jgi:hypothetical protein